MGNKGKVSIENLAHFSCGKCKRWWSIGDPLKNGHPMSIPEPFQEMEWFCPWCGVKQICKIQISKLAKI